MINYGYGNCVISIEGDENIYSVIPYYKGITLEKNTGYLKDGFVYVYRGDISRQKKFKNGIFTDKKGKVYFSLDPEESSKYAFENIKDDSIQSIIKQAEKIDPTLKKKIIRQITDSSDLFLPEFNEYDDCFKHIIKLILHTKRVDLKQFKDKFTKSHVLTNIKAALETKSTPDGKKGSLTIPNLFKWLELLDMEMEVKFKDADDSEYPCGKIFSYDKNGYKVEWNKDYEQINDGDFDDIEGDEENED